jgi:hypothetical protein
MAPRRLPPRLVFGPGFIWFPAALLSIVASGRDREMRAEALTRIDTLAASPDGLVRESARLAVLWIALGAVFVCIGIASGAIVGATAGSSAGLVCLLLFVAFGSLPMGTGVVLFAESRRARKEALVLRWYHALIAAVTAGLILGVVLLASV